MPATQANKVVAIRYGTATHGAEKNKAAKPIATCDRLYTYNVTRTNTAQGAWRSRTKI